GAYSGVKSKRRDLALIYSDEPAAAAAVFTRNVVVAEPIKLARRNIADGRAQVLVINSGNANACTGEQGRRGAEAMVGAAAEALELDPSLVIVASTGIIGRAFPTDDIVESIHTSAPKLSNLRLAGSLAANAILTTDTFAKASYSTFDIGGVECRMGGIAKGSGMIHPDMATMLAFIVSDAAIAHPLLDEALHEAVDESFNMITVDGDTSTNDMVCVLANGLAKNRLIEGRGPDYDCFRRELGKHCIELARQIVADGEGATKQIQYTVEGAPSDEAARRIARTVSDSNLVKTAFFGRDPNWGRIVAAAGRAGVDFDPEKLDLYLGTSKRMHQLLAGGQPVEVERRRIKNMMRAAFLYVLLDLNLGEGKATAWGTDFSYEYVRINAEYST
ncbi:MAG: bifunctional glutamate N-acetyltransferase/amino-acid acetyltransferase ArgJ, partial [Candidatus Eisenbacteria bacterium]|nr:bifunctional glutamate N-acetyltransferase/amino-acid acetyltransferase ArgJ [Candidatus Eisenbacteria bacterium]